MIPRDNPLDAALGERRSAKTGRARPVSETLVFAWRAILKIKHNPDQAFDMVASPIMFTVLFTYLFGNVIAGSPEAYLAFLLPGIMMQTVLFSCVHTGYTLNQDIARGVFDRFRALPIWRPAPIAGAIVGDFARYTISAALVLAVGFLMGYRPAGGPASILVALVLLNLFACGIGWVFTALALAMRSGGTMMTVSWLFLMPLTFGSNIYVEPATMPPWLAAFAQANPVSLIVTALRTTLDGAPDARAIALALAAPALVAAVFAPLTMRLYAKER